MSDEPFSGAFPAYQLAMKEANIIMWCNSVRDMSNYPYEP